MIYLLKVLLSMFILGAVVMDIASAFDDDNPNEGDGK